MNSRDDPGRYWTVSAALVLALAGLIPTGASAYTAAGDRTFPATLNVPQPAPADAFWGTLSNQPMEAEQTGDTTRQTQATGSYSKLITERLGIQISDGFTRSNRLGTSATNGAQNFALQLQYEPVIDQPHEFLLSFQVEQEFGGTGTRRAGSPAQSATTPGVTFAKGFGDLPIGYWRPLAITGFAGYQAGYGARTSQVQADFSLQYSMPYLVSKVADAGLPRLLRGTTPLVEAVYTTPVSGKGTTFVVAPGFSYSQGEGWEVAIEAMIPATKSAGRSIGVIAQFVLQFDYLMPDGVFGRPIFPSP